MLQITLPSEEFWDSDNERFQYIEGPTLSFEHSLVSLSKWESRFHKLFLDSTKKTEEEMFGYIEAMLLTPDVPSEVLQEMDESCLNKINDYINDPMTGTTFNEINQPQGRPKERISSELIYYWMSQFQIDKECEHWHLSRLFTLIRVHSAKSEKPKKMSKSAQARSMSELNAKRRAQLGSKG